MKRARRDRVLSRLYADLESADFDIREHAMFQLALMLRRATDSAPTSDSFHEDEHLSRDQLRLRLSSGDQAQVVARLLRLVSRQARSRATALWALAEVSSDIAFAPLLSAMRECGDQFSDEAAYQACRALRRWLEMDDLDRRLLDALPDEAGHLSCLKRWSRSNDPRLAKSADAVIRHLSELSN